MPLQMFLCSIFWYGPVVLSDSHQVRIKRMASVLIPGIEYSLRVNDWKRSPGETKKNYENTKSSKCRQ